MTLTVSDVRGVPVARIQGDIDTGNAPELADALSAAVPNAALGLVLDLRATGYLDSAGVRLLFETVERLGRRQQRLGLVVPRDSLVGDIVEMTDLGSYAGVDSGLAEALERLRETE